MAACGYGCGAASVVPSLVPSYYVRHSLCPHGSSCQYQSKLAKNIANKPGMGICLDNGRVVAGRFIYWIAVAGSRLRPYRWMACTMVFCCGLVWCRLVCHVHSNINSYTGMP